MRPHLNRIACPDPPLALLLDFSAAFLVLRHPPAALAVPGQQRTHAPPPHTSQFEEPKDAHLMHLGPECDRCDRWLAEARATVRL